MTHRKQPGPQLERLEDRRLLSGSDLWDPVPGQASAIDIGANGQVYVLGSGSVPGGHPIFRYNQTSNDWTQLPGGATSIAVDPQGDPYVLNSAGNVFHWARSRNDWDVLSGLGTAIDVGADGSVWLVGVLQRAGGHPIYRYTGGNWQDVGGGGVGIGVDPNGEPWLVNSDGFVFHWDGNTWQNMPGRGTDIDVGADGSVWLVGVLQRAGGHPIYRYTGSDWQDVGGGAVSIAVDPQGNPWVVNSSGNIFRDSIALSIEDTSVVEGNAGTTTALVTVSLSRPSAEAVSVQWATADGTARHNSDYFANSGAISFAPGETSKTIAIGVIGDKTFESDESFSVNLSNPVNAGIGKQQAIVTILNDDPSPIKDLRGKWGPALEGILRNVTPGGVSWLGIRRTITTEQFDYNSATDQVQFRVRINYRQKVFGHTLWSINATVGGWINLSNPTPYTFSVGKINVSGVASWDEWQIKLAVVSFFRLNAVAIRQS
jgi:hypothetical protein